MADTAAGSLSLYTATVKFSERISQRGILQVVYNTNNPAAPAQFVQCADLYLFKL